MTARAVQLRNTDPIAFLQVCNTRAERDNDIRQNPSMLELIQVHVDCGADHLSGPSVPLPNSTSRGATRANNNGNVPRGFCALWRTELVGCGVRVWHIKVDALRNFGKAGRLAHTLVSHHCKTVVVIRRKMLARNFRDLFGEVIGCFQVVAEEPHLAVNVALQQHLSLFIRELTMNRNGGGPANRCEVTLKFTAFLEACNRGVKNNEIGCQKTQRCPSDLCPSDFILPMNCVHQSLSVRLWVTASQSGVQLQNQSPNTPRLSKSVCRYRLPAWLRILDRPSAPSRTSTTLPFQ